MMRDLILIHGRAQENKDAVALKAEWVSAWRQGLVAAGLPMPLSDEQIRFPYYGQTLYDLTQGEADVADIILKGEGADAAERDFLRDVVEDILQERGVSSEQLNEVNELDRDFIEKGVQDWTLIRRALRAIDRYVPGASGATVAIVTRDVYHYLRNIGVRDLIDGGVRQALTSGKEAVVVAHSLGSVVAYNLLRREASTRGWRVPLLMTLGSPLAVTAIRRRLSPLGHPPAIDVWKNARDERDIVALRPLTSQTFPVNPEIENYSRVMNATANRHGISGYLDDPWVARAIYDAVTA